MSLHKSILRAVGRGVSQRIERKIVGGGAGSQKIIAAGVPMILGQAGRVLPAIGRVATAVGIGAAAQSIFGGGGAPGACTVGHHLNKQDGVGGPAGTYCVKNRRMNVGNARAARRAVRRLKGARKLLRDIEKMMPTRSTRRRAPQHHHHPAAGGN